MTDPVSDLTIIADENFSEICVKGKERFLANPVYVWEIAIPQSQNPLFRFSEWEDANYLLALIA